MTDGLEITVATHEGVQVLVVSATDSTALIASIKAHLREVEAECEEDCTCSECGYRAPPYRWGFQTYTFTRAVADWVVVRRCCPDCETPADLETAPDTSTGAW